jgi:glucokinase
MGTVHLQPVLTSPRFLQSFRHKGRLAEMMSRIPVHLMTGKVGITGTAAYGLKRALTARTTAGLRRAS